MNDLATALGAKSLVLLGCGKMGGALLDGWLKAGVSGAQIRVMEPMPSEALIKAADDFCLRLSDTHADIDPAVVVLAVKPQMMAEALPTVAAFAKPETLFVSIAAGTTIDFFKSHLGSKARIVRTMPNTPSAVGRGATALIADAAVDADQRALAEALMQAVGDVVWLENEMQMDAVTAVSGSGPAYVFHMIEALAAAAVAEGLPEDLAMTLARATVTGAGELAYRSDQPASQLRINVTSPGGTTAAGLSILMDESDGLGRLMRETVAAAARRSRELGG